MTNLIKISNNIPTTNANVLKIIIAMTSAQSVTQPKEFLILIMFSGNMLKVHTLIVIKVLTLALF